MQKEDFVLTSKANDIVVEYNKILAHLSNIDKDVQIKKNDLNTTIHKMSDPLGEDYISLCDFFEILKNELTELELKRNSCQIELDEVRGKERKLMETINTSPNKDKILQKVTSDNQLSIEINK